MNWGDVLFWGLIGLVVVGFIVVMSYGTFLISQDNSTPPVVLDTTPSIREYGQVIHTGTYYLLTPTIDNMEGGSNGVIYDAYESVTIRNTTGNSTGVGFVTEIKVLEEGLSDIKSWWDNQVTGYSPDPTTIVIPLPFQKGDNVTYLVHSDGTISDIALFGD